MSKVKSLVGVKFGRWSVQSYAYSRRTRPFWNCLCECGTVGIVRGEHLKIGKSKSCGCWHRDVVTTNNGRSKHPLYNCWRNLVQRCTNPLCEAYADYGGRGISLDTRWLDFDEFVADINTLGGRPSPRHSLDRIDNEGGYHINNVKWSTWNEQAKNRRQVRSLQNYSTEELLKELKRRKVFNEYVRSQGSHN